MSYSEKLRRDLQLNPEEKEPNMARGNPAVYRIAVKTVAEKHPEWTAEQVIDVVEKLDDTGALALNPEGRLFIDTSSEEKFQTALRLVPNIIQPPSGDTDRDKVNRSRIKAAKLGEAPPQVPDQAKIKERLAALPKPPAGASDRVKCLHAAARERIMLGIEDAEATK